MKTYLNSEDKELEVVQDNTIDIYTPTDNEGRTANRYFKRLDSPQRDLHGEPVSVVDTEEGALKVKMT